uniref:Uncharacterized protein n=1 Tax=Sinocyclocheilus rhinocerous TaxID=307959 RepID=A0A673NR40_9TELE
SLRTVPHVHLFEKLGHLVGSYPFCFFVIPLMISAALGGGLNFLKVHEDNDVENQFTPINGPSKQTRHFIKETFPSNDSLFSSQRLYAEGNYAVMIFSIVEGNILTDALFEEISELDKQVHILYTILYHISICTVSSIYLDNFLNLQVSHFTSLSRQEEIEKHTTDGIPLFSITYSLAISFSVLSCMR